MVRTSLVRWLVAVSLALTVPALAHHSFSMFDRDKEVTKTGTVKSFAWTNPHVWLDVMVAGDNDAVQIWGLEAQTPAILYRGGWKQDSLKPGDKVTVLLHPMRDGTLGGQLMKVTFADGQVLNAGGPPAARPAN
jgi:hypothetical protein